MLQKHPHIGLYSIFIANKCMTSFLQDCWTKIHLGNFKNMQLRPNRYIWTSKNSAWLLTYRIVYIDFVLPFGLPVVYILMPGVAFCVK